MTTQRTKFLEDDTTCLGNEQLVQHDHVRVRIRFNDAAHVRCDVLQMPGRTTGSHRDAVDVVAEYAHPSFFFL